MPKSHFDFCFFLSDQRLAERQRRTIAHDGHFQAMDDANNRDKLVKRYGQLYDTADLVSASLEDSYGLTVGSYTVEDEASRFLQNVVLVRGNDKLWHSVKKSLQQAKT